jgi:RNA polymerase sigma-70 factor (ECF subfamily)
MDEISLIHAAQKGELDAFNRLVLAYQDIVYNQALRMLSDEDAAADAAQETFISAYRHIQDYRGGSFRAWLLRIVTNACYDALRRNQRRPTTSLEPLDDTGEEIESPHWLADNSNLPEEKAEQRELASAISNCLQGLPDEFRAAVILVDVQGLDYSEAAQSLGKPVGTIKSRLARARLRLRDCLHGFWELLPAEFRLAYE